MELWTNKNNKPAIECFEPYSTCQNPVVGLMIVYYESTKNLLWQNVGLTKYPNDWISSGQSYKRSTILHCTDWKVPKEGLLRR